MSIDAMFLRSADRIDIPRHPRWGGPMIVPPGGGKETYYQRISTYAKLLDDASSLNLWYGRMTALGLARRPDLAMLAGTLQPDDKNALNNLVEQAMDAAQSSAAANRGTALHAATEHVDLGGDIEALPADMRDDISAYQQAMNRLTVLAIEKFVVLDDLKVAGTFDRLLLCPDGKIRVGDLKTGSSAAAFPHSAAAQTAMYAHGVMYTPDGTRTPMPNIDLDHAVLIHLPQGTGTCELHLLDIRAGWEAAQLGIRVKEWRKSKIATPYTP
jgi:hypothetical protein